MFGHATSVVGLSGTESLIGESLESRLEDELFWEITQQSWSQPDRHVLPPGIDEIPPGPYLAAVLSAVDRTRLNGHDLVSLMKAEARLAASYEADKLATMAEVAFAPPGGPDSPVQRTDEDVEYASVEVATALTMTRRSAERELENALSLRFQLSRVWDQMKSGHIGWRKVREFIRELSHQSEHVIGEVLDKTLDEAIDLTSGQLGRRISKQVMIADPNGAESAYEEGLADRKLTSYANPDFTGSLCVHNADPVTLAEALANVERVARSLKEIKDETRSLDQLRADVALDLLAGKWKCGRGSKRHGSVHLTADIETLTRLANQPGHLNGYGPVIADIARQLGLELVDGEWTFQVTDPDGDVVATGTTSRRPNRAQKRRSRADYPTCVFPGCRQPACNCDLDHRREHSRGGATHNHNLAPLCRHHHMTRHHTNWRLERLPNGDHKWTSPLGHAYIREKGPPD